MLYNIVIEQVSQRMVFCKILKNSRVRMWSAFLYVKCSFSLVVYFIAWERSKGT